MAQIIDPLPRDKTDPLVCCYVNATNRIQIARITNIANWYFERVVFPGQRLFFEALPEAMLEIHSGMMASSILSDTIPCTRLCVNQSNNISSSGGELESSSEKQDKTLNIKKVDHKITTDGGRLPAVVNAY